MLNSSVLMIKTSKQGPWLFIEIEMLELTSILHYMHHIHASDLHLSTNAPIMLRKDGRVRKVAFQDHQQPLLLNHEQCRKLIYDLLSDRQKKRLEEHLEIDLAIALEDGVRFRGNVFFQERGIAAVFRSIPSEILSIERLGLPHSINDLIQFERGLILVTGPTGCGKSTTLAAMIDAINSQRESHIITIEDPIEFIHRPKKGMINQRELNTHTKSFPQSLKSALRQDPDVILVGEMRDTETISLALTAAETGHLILSTLHSNNAAQTVERVVSAFPGDEQARIRATFSYCLAGILSQVLLPRLGGGRVAAFEILVATPAVRALIRDGKTAQLHSTIQTGARHGMQTLEQSLEKLVFERKISSQVADHHRHVLGLELGKN